MARMRVLVALALLALALPLNARGLQVGIAPFVMDMGDMLPGDSKKMDFFIVSDHDEDLTVDLSVIEAKRSFFNPQKARNRYAFVEDEASEEEVAPWITLIEDPVNVPPEKQLRYLEQGGAAYANRKVSFIISVPEDAEPGYHSGTISPHPSYSGEGNFLGIVQSSEMNFVVNVLGNPVRDAEILDVSFNRDNAEKGTIRVLVKNRGTVTLSASADSVALIDSAGDAVRSIATPVVSIEPGKIGVLEKRFMLSGMEGDYLVKANVEWMTGEDSFEGRINTGDYVPVPVITGQAVAPGPLSVTGFPLWIIPIALGLVGAFVFWRLR